MTDALKKKLVTLEGLQEFYNTALPGGVVNGETDHYVTSPSGTAGSSSSNRTRWTGTVTGISALYTGLKVMFKIPIAGVAAGCTLNINSLGEHPVVINANSTITTHYPVNSILPLIYDADLTASVTVNSAPTSYTGCWKVINYDSNSDTRVTQTATSTSANYEVLFSATANNTTLTEAARKNNNLLFNPSTGNLQTTKLNGVTIGSSPKFTDTLPLVSTTYSALKTLRDNSLLIPGQLYRITDYVTTTAQENTQSAGHAFDIIVVADDVNVLNENAQAIKHSGDTYFADSKLEAWELKYCIDNDTTRFAWADDTNGKGVIYYMKDEFENECPYDFKNIMFKRWYGSEVTSSKTATEDMISAMEEMFVGHYHSHSPSDLGLGNSGLEIKIDSNNSKFFYTFSLSDDGETVYDGSLKHYGDNMYTNNVIKEYLPFDDYDIIHKLNNIVFKPMDSSADDCKNNIFGKNCYDMTIGFSWTYNNTFGDGCSYNFLGSHCSNNTFGNDFDNNTFGNNYSYNSFGNACSDNTFGNTCLSNSFGNNCSSNTFGNDCYNNSFRNNCSSNTFGNECNNNSSGNNYYNNSFGNECKNNSFRNYCHENTFGNCCNSNSFGNECNNNSFGNECYYNSFGNDCQHNSFGNYCENNTFGNSCYYNTFGDNCYYNTFGNSCNRITFAKDYMYYNIVENGNQYITVSSTATTSSSNVIRNITIAQGVNNTTTNKTISHNKVNDTFQTIYKPTNSVEVSV